MKKYRSDDRVQKTLTMDRTAARIHIGLSANTDRNQISVLPKVSLNFYQYVVKVAGDGPAVAGNLSRSVNSRTFLAVGSVFSKFQ